MTSSEMQKFNRREVIKGAAALSVVGLLRSALKPANAALKNDPLLDEEKNVTPNPEAEDEIALEIFDSIMNLRIDGHSGTVKEEIATLEEKYPNLSETFYNAVAKVIVWRKQSGHTMMQVFASESFAKEVYVILGSPPVEMVPILDFIFKKLQEKAGHVLGK